MAQVAATLKKAEGTSTGINYNKPPKNFAGTRSCEDATECMQAYRKGYQGFKDHDRNAVRVVIPPPGAKVLGSTTRTANTVEQGVLEKRKVSVFARGDQQAYGI